MSQITDAILTDSQRYHLNNHLFPLMDRLKRVAQQRRNEITHRVTPDRVAIAPSAGTPPPAGGAFFAEVQP